MADVFATNLIGMTAIGTHGTTLGEASDITTNVNVGELLHLVIDPDGTADQDSIDIAVDENDFFELPIERIHAVNDYIVVEL